MALASSSGLKPSCCALPSPRPGRPVAGSVLTISKQPVDKLISKLMTRRPAHGHRHNRPRPALDLSHEPAPFGRRRHRQVHHLHDAGRSCVSRRRRGRPSSSRANSSSVNLPELRTFFRTRCRSEARSFVWRLSRSHLHPCDISPETRLDRSRIPACDQSGPSMLCTRKEQSGAHTVPSG